MPSPLPGITLSRLLPRISLIKDYLQITTLSQSCARSPFTRACPLLAHTRVLTRPRARWCLPLTLALVGPREGVPLGQGVAGLRASGDARGGSRAGRLLSAVTSLAEAQAPLLICFQWQFLAASLPAWGREALGGLKLLLREQRAFLCWVGFVRFLQCQGAAVPPGPGVCPVPLLAQAGGDPSAGGHGRTRPHSW